MPAEIARRRPCRSAASIPEWRRRRRNLVAQVGRRIGHAGLVVDDQLRAQAEHARNDKALMLAAGIRMRPPAQANALSQGSDPLAASELLD